tara:strand:- start:203 stop:712 length:510 start_codon:yes stop_codon:yes gene_type:complete
MLSTIVLAAAASAQPAQTAAWTVNDYPDHGICAARRIVRGKTSFELRMWPDGKVSIVIPAKNPRPFKSDEEYFSVTFFGASGGGERIARYNAEGYTGQGFVGYRLVTAADGRTDKGATDRFLRYFSQTERITLSLDGEQFLTIPVHESRRAAAGQMASCLAAVARSEDF